ncbi:transglycosylase SLT domain-containing protein [Streptomyces sp. NPDC051976]|uniref:transglycosylase SLT domain-containing protein n=1 Tax=Streptomyces sp. NPDC051976 TaxID=3154947 RepID=UPI00342D6EA0
MQLPTIPKFGRLTKTHKITAAGAVAATAVVLAVTGLQGTGGSASAAADPTGFSVASPQAKSLDTQADLAKQKAIHDAAAKKAADAAAAKKKADAAAAAKKAAAAKRLAAERARAKQAANRSTHRVVLQPKKTAVAPKAAVKTYTNDLDGWIKHSLDIMAADGIPGSYDGIYRNIIRESSGNPQAINLWDSNAAAGIPSKGLLQVIDPTFQAYHVAGTSWDIYDPVANITAACNYAYHVYGSMDNVNSAY